MSASTFVVLCCLTVSIFHLVHGSEQPWHWNTRTESTSHAILLKVLDSPRMQVKRRRLHLETRQPRKAPAPRPVGSTIVAEVLIG